MAVNQVRRRCLAVCAMIPFLGSIFPFVKVSGKMLTPGAVYPLLADEVKTVLQRVTNPMQVGEKYLEYRVAGNKAISREYFQKELDEIVNASTELVAIENLRANIDHDFRSDNTLLLDGWIYARTECTLCALLVAAA